MNDLSAAAASSAIRPGEPGTRRAQLIVPEPGLVRAWVEDNFHHFEIAIAHDGERVRKLEATAHRWPWMTCPAAGVYLGERMQGARLADLGAVDSPFSHCTHMHDLALLAAAHAHDDAPLLYSSFASDQRQPAQRAELRRNGRLVLSWSVRNDVVTSPDAANGQSLRKLRDWSSSLPPDEAEMARVLRRCIFISGGRIFDYTATPRAAMITASAGACFTFQPERAGTSALTMDMRELDGACGPLDREIAQHPAVWN
jgi:Protein of unknown function (DUF2889).